MGKKSDPEKEMYRALAWQLLGMALMSNNSAERYANAALMCERVAEVLRAKAEEKYASSEHDA